MGMDLRQAPLQEVRAAMVGDMAEDMKSLEDTAAVVVEEESSMLPMWT